MASTPKPTTGSSSSSSSTSAPKPNSTTRNVDKFGNVTEKTYDDKGNLSSQTRYNEKAGNVSRNPVTGKNEVIKTNPLGGGSSSNTSNAVAQPTTTATESELLKSIRTQLEQQKTAQGKIQLSVPQQSRQTPINSPFIPNSDQIGKYKIVNTNSEPRNYTPATQSNTVSSQSFSTMAQQSTQDTKPRVSVLSMASNTPNYSPAVPKGTTAKVDTTNLPQSRYFTPSSTRDAELAFKANQVVSLPAGVRSVNTYDPTFDSNTGAPIGVKTTTRDFMTLSEANDYMRRQTPAFIAAGNDIARTNAIKARADIKAQGITRDMGVFGYGVQAVDTALKFSGVVAAEESRKILSFVQSKPAEAFNILSSTGAFKPLGFGDKQLPVAKDDKVFGIDKATFQYLSPRAFDLSPTVNPQNIVKSAETIGAGIALSAVPLPGAQIAGSFLVGYGQLSIASEFGKQINYETLNKDAKNQVKARYDDVKLAYNEGQKVAIGDNEKDILFGVKSADLPLFSNIGRYAPSFVTSANLRETVAARDERAANKAFEITGSPVLTEFVRQQRLGGDLAQDAGLISLSSQSNKQLSLAIQPTEKVVIGGFKIPFIGTTLKQESAGVFSADVLSAGTTGQVIKQAGNPFGLNKYNAASFVVGGAESAAQTNIELRNQGQQATVGQLATSFAVGGASTLTANRLLSGSQALKTIGKSPISRKAGAVGEGATNVIANLLSAEEYLGDTLTRVTTSPKARSAITLYSQKSGLVIAREGFSIGDAATKKSVVFGFTPTASQSAAAKQPASNLFSMSSTTSTNSLTPVASNTQAIGGQTETPVVSETKNRPASRTFTNSFSLTNTPAITNTPVPSITNTNTFSNTNTFTNTNTNTNTMTNTVTYTNTFQNFPFFAVPGNKGSSPASAIGGFGKPGKKKKTAYLPSVSAVFLNIRAKKGKRTQAAAFTGLGIRPILR